MKHTISVLVDNHFGVLARISGLFSARGYNIDSLCVGVTEDPTISRMTVVVNGDETVMDQIEKQLNKLLETIEVVDLTNENHVERELILVKLKATSKTRSEILEVANVFRAKTVHVAPNELVIEATGNEGKLSAFLDMVRPFGILELVRTGKVAIARSGNGATKE